MAKKRVYCLYRVSTKKQLDKDRDDNHEDIPMQRKVCRDFAERQGWEIVDEKFEKGVSGFKVSAKDRDEIQIIQQDALKGMFDILLVFMFDRIGRIDDETPFIVEWFVKNGIEVWSANEGQQRFDNHVDKLLNYIRYWQASGESIKTSIRTKTRLGQIVEEGHFRGGTCPFGYRLEKQGRIGKKGHELYEILIDENEEPIVKLIFEKYIHEGLGTHRIGNFLAEKGIRNRKGQSFTNKTIQYMLQNPMYMGILRSGETQSEIFPELQIVDAEVFEQAQKLMQTRLKAAKEDSQRMHTKGVGLLTGKIYCGHCGGRLVQTSNVKKDYDAQGNIRNQYSRVRYVCYNKTRHRTCDGQTGYTTRIADNCIDEIIHNMFAKAINTPQNELIDVRYYDRMREFKANLKRAGAILTKAQNAYNAYKEEMLRVIRGESVFDRETLNEALMESKSAVETATADVERCTADMENGIKVYDELKKRHETLLTWAEMYDKSSPEAKKMIISQIIDKIHIRSGYEMDIDFNISFQDYCEGIESSGEELSSEMEMALKQA